MPRPPKTSSSPSPASKTGRGPPDQPGGLTLAARYLVVAGSTIGEVVPVTTRHAVVAIAANHRVVAGATIEDIVATIAPDRVITATGHDGVLLAGAADDDRIAFQELPSLPWLVVTSGFPSASTGKVAGSPTSIV